MQYQSKISTSSIPVSDVRQLLGEVPQDLIDFWHQTSAAELFIDIASGQWGLNIVDPKRAIELTHTAVGRRPTAFREGDLVIGYFVGDSDVLVIRCDTSQVDFGNVLVAPAIDPRAEWSRVAKSLGEFLAAYAGSKGDKYWE
jgi:hypothetical protein